MSKDALAKAVWHGPFEAVLPDGTVLRAGDTFDVPASQLSSAHLAQSQAKAEQDKAAS